MIREVQKEAREYPQCGPLTDSAPETIDYSFEAIQQTLEDHSRRLCDCESSQLQLQQQFSDLSRLVNSSLLSGFSHSSKDPTSGISVVHDEVSMMQDQGCDSLTRMNDDTPLIPPLVSDSCLPPLKHIPVEQGHMDQWDDLLVDDLITEVSLSLRQWIRERQQLLILKRQLLLKEYGVDSKVISWYEQEIKELEVRKEWKINDRPITKNK